MIIKDKFELSSNGGISYFFLDMHCGCGDICTCHDSTDLVCLSSFKLEVLNYLKHLMGDCGLRATKRFSKICLNYPSRNWPQLPSSSDHKFLSIGVDFAPDSSCFMQFLNNSFKTKNKLFKQQMQMIFDECDLDWVV